MLELSKRFLGLPYTWGGTSSLRLRLLRVHADARAAAAACSMPRDAQPQADWSGVAAGGARAICSPATCSTSAAPTKKITHTGMYLGDGKFINATTHETPMVRIDDLNDPYWTRLLVAMQESEMNRRDFLKAAAVAPAAGRLAGAPAAATAASLTTQDRAPEPAAHLDHHHVVQRVPRHAARRAITRDGITGHGEGAPIVRYHEDAESARKAVEIACATCCSPPTPCSSPRSWPRSSGACTGEWAGKAAIDIALMDWVGQKLGIPLYRYFGLDPEDAPLTTFSIGIDTPGDHQAEDARSGAIIPVLKVKVGLATDEPTIEAVRSVTNKPLRVDANEGWKDKEEAVRKINWLEKQGVEFIEQPHARGDARRDALGAQPRAHSDHRRRSLPARRRHPQARRTPSTASTSSWTRAAACWRPTA